MMGRALLAATILGLAGCAVFQEPSPAPEGEPAVEAELAVVKPRSIVKPRVVVPEPAAPSIDALLAEFERFRRLSAPDLAREQEAARQAFNQTRNDASRIQLAMAITVPGSAGNDEARALELLEPLVKNSVAPLHGVAFVLAAHIQEQRRLLAQMQGLQQNNQGLQQNVQALQQNVQGLQQKLDALRTLERSLSERTEPAARKR
jgi:cell division protein FtsB